MSDNYKLMAKVSILFLALALGACGGPKNQDENQSQKERIVATSIYPVYTIIREIAPDSLNFFYAIPVGANPHSFDPNPDVIKKLQKIDLFIGIHPRLDGYIAELVQKEKFFISQAVTNSQKSKNSPKAQNPHIWLNLQGAQDIARLGAAKLSKLYPEHQKEIQSNLKTYRNKLGRLNQKIRTILEPYAGAKLMQWHPAWDAFAADYNLQVVGTLEKGHGAKASLQKFHNLVRIARKQNVRAIILGLNIQSKTTQALSKETGVPIVRLDSIGRPDDSERDSYAKLMLYNARRLAQALQQKDEQ
jgi:ABC-type Zn uptake system ZnuABC Zn-binding protein ZnuA